MTKIKGLTPKGSLPFLLLVAATALTSGCGAHHRAATAAPATLPRIHEAFTLLPCPRKQVTTVDLEGCAEHEILRTDRAIQTKARLTFTLLGVQGRRAFAAAERSWLAYRKEVCDAESSEFAGGTIEPLVFAHCVADQNRRHLAELSALKNGLQDNG